MAYDKGLGPFAVEIDGYLELACPHCWQCRAGEVASRGFSQKEEC